MNPIHSSIPLNDYESEYNSEVEKQDIREFRPLTANRIVPDYLGFKPIQEVSPTTELEPSHLSLANTVVSQASPTLSEYSDTSRQSSEIKTESCCSCKKRKVSRKRSRISWLRGIF